MEGLGLIDTLASRVHASKIQVHYLLESSLSDSYDTLLLHFRAILV